MSIRGRVRDAREKLRRHLRLSPRWTGSTELAEFMRPDLGDTPQVVRRPLEPLVAGIAIAVIAAFAGFGFFGFTVLALAAAVIFAILHYVFGIDLDLAFPA